MNMAFQGLEETAKAIREGDSTSVQVTEACLAQIDAYNDSLAVFNQVLRQEALERAAALDRDRGRGVVHGPLHGVPFAVKDLMDIAGYSNSCGTAHRRDGAKATTTAAAAQAMLNAGAVLVGLTNLHEWAYGGTSSNPHFGFVRNAWDSDRIPGGSSGGSAVAVSAGMAYAALGTDTGGSVRIPASMTGTAALKVTVGGISTAGVHPLSWTLDSVGPMARKVADLRTPYEVMATTGPGITANPRRISSLRGLRVGIDRSYYLEEGRIEPAVYEGFQAILKKLAELGVEIVEVSVPSLKFASSAQYTLVLAEASAVHSGPLLANRPLYGDDVQGYLALGDTLLAQDYIASLRFRDRLFRDYKAAFAAVDFLVSPSTPFASSPIGQETFLWPDGSEESLLDACWRFTFPSNLAGIPSLSMATGLADNGLPLSLQLIGSPLSEIALLDAGELLEREFTWDNIPTVVKA